jgi:hypothetical protein
MFICKSTFMSDDVNYLLDTFWTSSPVPWCHSRRNPCFQQESKQSVATNNAMSERLTRIHGLLTINSQPLLEETVKTALLLF